MRFSQLGIVVLGLGLAFSCQSPPTLELRYDDIHLEKKGALMLYQEEAFSGTINSYYPSGTLKSSTTYKNGKRDGLSVQWSELGIITEKRIFKSGEKVGVHFAWWDSGKPRFEYGFENGLHHGIYKEWDNQGRLAVSKNYQNGQEEGIQQTWYDNGNLKANYVVKNGKRYGSLGFKICKPISDEVL